MNPIVPLNLPKTNLSIKRSNDNLFVHCLIRKKAIKLTPEEWVRQHFIAEFLEMKYPKGLMSVEKKISYGELTKRWDLAVFKTDQSCFLLLECKAPHIKITKSVFEQSLVYYRNLQSDYLILSNGITHLIMKKDHNRQCFEQLKSFPEYLNSE